MGPVFHVIVNLSTIRHSAPHGILLSLCIAGVNGCGSGTVPIEGTVTLDGQPLADVQILFDQPDIPGGHSFAGRTDGEGRYLLHPVGKETDSPVAGAYRVTLTTAVAERTAIEGTPLPPERVPRKYRNGSLQFEVPAGGTDTGDFALESR